MRFYQQSFEINTCTQSINVNFVSTNRQFAFLEVSSGYDKIEQHKTIYNSYNAEIAAAKMQSLKTENASITYALTNKIKFDVDAADETYWLYSQFVACSCNGFSIAPLTYYANNEVYWELLR